MSEPDHRDDGPSDLDLEAAALLAYEAWCEAREPSLTRAFEPTWAELTDDDRQAWRSAAKAVLDVKSGAVLT